MWHHQAIGVGGAESSMTRYIGNMEERPNVTWCLDMCHPAWKLCRCGLYCCQSTGLEQSVTLLATEHQMQTIQTTTENISDWELTDYGT